MQVQDDPGIAKHHQRESRRRREPISPPERPGRQQDERKPRAEEESTLTCEHGQYHCEDGLGGHEPMAIGVGLVHGRKLGHEHVVDTEGKERQADEDDQAETDDTECGHAVPRRQRMAA